MSHLCIYHKSCADGFGAALAVKCYFDLKGGECEYLAAQYGDAPPDVAGLDVIIVDFSYPRDVLVAMNDKAKSMIVLDHHKTAKQNLEGLDFCIFDMERSGAMMAWEYFHGGDSVPMLIRYVQDRDLWKWELDDSKSVSCGLELLAFNFDAWKPYLNDENLDQIKSQGNTVLQYQERLVSMAVNQRRIRMISLFDYNVPIVNATNLISEVGNSLAESFPFGVTYFDAPKERVYSLRSIKGGVDVSVIAASFGGGGHATAAGFSIAHGEAQL